MKMDTHYYRLLSKFLKKKIVEIDKIPLISVIIPSRIGEKIDSLQSIVNQTHNNIEIIIEYDYYQRGASFVRNMGAKKAQGDYLFFCDNDVELEPDCLESLLSNIGDYGWIFGKLQVGDIVLNKDRKFNPKCVNDFSCISTMSLIKAECNPVFDVDMLRYNDWDLWIRLWDRGYKGKFLDKLILKTVDREGGISTGQDSHYWKTYLYEKHKDFDCSSPRR
jgi:glycosyltransferase involved in cell wall biosynthesis